ncbi:MAG: hypothetical protein SFW65_08285 [Alphaproteobacteria bacterium]|nr:hypothetical protein [Alphaproteobacteria bacterium]
MGILLTIAAYRLAHDTRPDAAPTGFAINVLKNSVSYFADCGDIRQIEIWGKLHSALSRIPDMSDSARTLAFNAAIPQRITERNMPFLKEAAERWGEALDRWIHGGDQEGYETRLKTGGPNAARRALGHLDQLNAPADFPLRIVAANRIASYKAGEIPTPPVERPGYLAAFVGLLKRAASLGRA